MTTWAIQQALYEKISGDAGVTALCSNIVDFGPRADDAAGIYPYIAMGSLIFSDHDTDTTNGFDITARIHCYSDQRGARQVRQIQDALYALLHVAELTVSGYKPIIMYREQSDVMQTSRGAMHGVDEYRLLIEKL